MIEDKEEFNSRFDTAIAGYIYTCNDIANLFCEKHDFYPVKVEGSNDDFGSFWANDEPGTTLFCGDMCFSMEDIILDLQQDTDPSKIIQYWDYEIKENHGPEYVVNYKTWLKYY